MSGNVTITQGEFTSKLEDDSIKEHIMTVLGWLDEALISYENQREELEAEAREKEYEEKINELSDNAEEFMQFLSDHNLSLIDFIWYASEWLTGGESKNVMKGFLCHLSTYFLIKAIWFMALGPAGEGKSIIEDATFELMPLNSHMNGRISDKGVNRKTLELGSDYPDGKILRMKDLGGKDDIQKWYDTLQKYKELTTEGKTEFETTSETVNQETGERGTISFLVTGRPSVSFTTVNTEAFDDQILSRGINVSPEASNEDVRRFFIYNQGKYADQREHVIKKELPLLHNYIEYIKEFYRDIKIINPYWPCIEQWFNSSEYYKRALSMYPSLVETVTLLNYHYRDVIEKGDSFYLLSSKEDNELVAGLFNPNQGISEPATRLFNLILKWYKGFDPDELREYYDGDKRIRDCKTFFTAGEVRYRASKIRHMKGLPYGDILSSLVSHGLIEAVDKEKRSNKNIYVLSHFEKLEPTEIVFDKSIILKHVIELEKIYGFKVEDVLTRLVEDDFEKPKNDVKVFNSDLKLPPWKSQVFKESAVYKGSCPNKSEKPIFDTASRPPSEVQSPDKSAPILPENEESNTIEELKKEWEGF